MAASKSIYREIETTGAPLPDGWRWVEVEEIAELVSRGITPKYDESSAETVLGQTCVRNNLVLIENGRHHKPKKINEKWLREGDLLINSTGVGSLGRTAQVWFEPEKLTVDSHITIVRTRKPEHALYLGFWAFAHERYIESLHTGSTGQTELPRDHVKAIRLVLPDAATLSWFNSIAEPAVKAIVANQVESKKLEALRDALLPKLMSGELDVSKVEVPTPPNSHLPVHRYCILQTVPIRIWKGTAMEAIINTVLAQMQPLLNGHQLKQLAITLRAVFEHDKQPPKEDPADLLALFLTAKEVEGCSPKTIAYYRTTLEHMTEAVAKPYTQVTSDDLRSYLTDYELKRGAGKVTVDNIRRIMSSFFSWLEDEDYVVKSPVRRIHRVKCAQVTKEVLTDEQVESLRDGCTCTRDLAIIEMLASTGMRVGELVRLDIADVDLQERECVVIGKGNKQRPVYFDARAKLRINEYLALRHDDSPALFVSLRGEPKRMTIGNVETRMRELGRATSVGRVHPHKFRRTLATRAIDKGMPIEQVQKLLGHAKIDTTMRYAMVDQNNVKTSHRKYLE